MVEDYIGEILLFIRQQPGQTVSHNELKARFGENALSVADDLADKGYLDRLYQQDAFRLQSNGRSEASKYELHREQQHQQRAKEKAVAKKELEEERASERAYMEKQQKKGFHHDYRLAIFHELLGGIIGLVAGLIIEGYAHLAERVFQILSSVLR